MLEHLFGSKTRVKLLTVFLHHPEDVFFVRELTRRIDTQINAVRREIQNLLDLGLISEGVAKEDEAGVKRPGLKRKYYVANRTFPLYQELHALLTKAHILIERKLDDRIRRLGDVKYLAFMGSFLGTPGDIDLFLVGTVDDKELRAFLSGLETELGFEVNYTKMTPQDFAYRKDVADRFLHSILLAPKHIVIDKLDA